MAKANARLRVSFDFDLLLPETMTQADRAALGATLSATLGATVFKGMRRSP